MVQEAVAAPPTAAMIARASSIRPHNAGLLAGLGAGSVENAEAAREIACAGNIREPPERLGALGTGGKRGDEHVQHRLCRRPVARRKEVIRGGQAAPGSVGAVVVGREPARLPGQLRRRVGRPSLRRLSRDLLEVGRQAIVGSAAPSARWRARSAGSVIRAARSPCTRRRSSAVAAV